MNLRENLSQRMGKPEIYEIIFHVRNNEKLKQELYNLVFDSDETVALHATWVLCHYPASESEWLHGKQNELIDEVLQCTHPGKRRQLLNIIQLQSFTNSPRVDFLDFCLNGMVSKDELPAVKSLCIKLAYELCRNIPELLQELLTLLEIMEPDLLSPAVRAVRRNTLKAIKKQRNTIS